MVPLRATPGLLFLAGLVVGLVALAQRLVLSSSRPASPILSLASLAGTLGLVAWSAAARQGWQGVALIAVFGVIAFASAASSVPAAVDAVGPTDQEQLMRRPAHALAPVLIAAAAVAVAVAVAAIPLGTPATGATAVPPTGLALADHLVDLEAHDPNLVVFTAGRRFLPTGRSPS